MTMSIDTVVWLVLAFMAGGAWGIWLWQAFRFKERFDDYFAQRRHDRRIRQRSKKVAH